MKLHCVNNISLNTVWLPSFNLTEYCNAFLHFRTFTLMYVHPWRYTNTHSYISLRVIHSKKLLEHIVGYSAQHYHHHNYMMLSTALAPNQSIGSILFKEFLRGKPLKAHVTAIFSLHICQIDHSSLHQFLLILFPLTTSASRSLIIPWCSHGITTLGQITITPPKPQTNRPPKAQHQHGSTDQAETTARMVLLNTFFSLMRILAEQNELQWWFSPKVASYMSCLPLCTRTGIF